MKNHFFRAFLILCATSFIAQNAIAQKPKKKDPDVQVIDFGEDQSKVEVESSYNGLILKTSPISYVFGRQMLELEKEMSGSLSLQVGLGATFAPLWSNYNQLLTELNDQDGYCESNQWTYDECDNYSDYSYRRGGGAGLLASASLRLFFDDDGYEGQYIAPVLRYSVNKFQVQQIEPNQSFTFRDPNNWQDEHEKKFDLMVHYGAQELYPKLSAEWFIGAGLRFSNNLRQDLGYDEFGIVQNGERMFKEKKFRLEAGIRIGFRL